MLHNHLHGVDLLVGLDGLDVLVRLEGLDRVLVEGDAGRGLVSDGGARWPWEGHLREALDQAVFVADLAALAGGMLLGTGHRQSCCGQ